MRYAGRITEWNDERGFGFVTPNGGGDRAFVHIKGFRHGSRRPVVDQLVSWELRKDERGRFNAEDVRLVDLRAASKRGASKGWPRKTVAVLCMAGLVTGWYSGKFPAIVPLVYGAMSVFAILHYALDKSAAKHDRWRTQESTLHLVALLGGWPGAMFAQGALHHKSRKGEFQAVFFVTVMVNCAALVAALNWFGPEIQRFSAAIEQWVRILMAGG